MKDQNSGSPCLLGQIKYYQKQLGRYYFIYSYDEHIVKDFLK